MANKNYTPHQYDKNSRSFNEGAHKHWRGCFDRDGYLNRRGERRLEGDIITLEYAKKRL